MCQGLKEKKIKAIASIFLTLAHRQNYFKSVAFEVLLKHGLAYIKTLDRFAVLLSKKIMSRRKLLLC